MRTEASPFASVDAVVALPVAFKRLRKLFEDPDEWSEAAMLQAINNYENKKMEHDFGPNMYYGRIASHEDKRFLFTCGGDLPKGLAVVLDAGRHNGGDRDIKRLRARGAVYARQGVPLNQARTWIPVTGERLASRDSRHLSRDDILRIHPPRLSSIQEKVRNDLHGSAPGRRYHCLQGVAGSGKTEILSSCAGLNLGRDAGRGLYVTWSGRLVGQFADKLRYRHPGLEAWIDCRTVDQVADDILARAGQAGGGTAIESESSVAHDLVADNPGDWRGVILPDMLEVYCGELLGRDFPEEEALLYACRNATGDTPGLKRRLRDFREWEVRKARAGRKDAVLWQHRADGNAGDGHLRAAWKEYAGRHVKELVSEGLKADGVRDEDPRHLRAIEHAVDRFLAMYVEYMKLTCPLEFRLLPYGGLACEAPGVERMLREAAGRETRLRRVRRALELLCREPDRADGRWSWIMVDEVQDLTEIEIAMLLRYTRRDGSQVCVCAGDSLQQIQPAQFDWGMTLQRQIYAHGSMSKVPDIVRLSAPKRMSRAVCAVAKVVAQARMAAKHVKSLDIEADLEPDHGCEEGVSGIMPLDGEGARNLYGMFSDERTKDKMPGVAVLTLSEDHISSLDARGVPVVNRHSVSSAKGLEWDHVYLWLPEVPREFAAQRGLRAFLSYLFTACTRARLSFAILLGDQARRILEECLPAGIPGGERDVLPRVEDIEEHDVVDGFCTKIRSLEAEVHGKSAAARAHMDGLLGALSARFRALRDLSDDEWNDLSDVEEYEGVLSEVTVLCRQSPLMRGSAAAALEVWVDYLLLMGERDGRWGDFRLDGLRDLAAGLEPGQAAIHLARLHDGAGAAIVHLDFLPDPGSALADRIANLAHNHRSPWLRAMRYKTLRHRFESCAAAQESGSH